MKDGQPEGAIKSLVIFALAVPATAIALVITLARCAWNMSGHFEAWLTREEE